MTPVLRLLLAGLLMEGCFAGMVAVGDLRSRISWFLLLYFLAFFVYLGAVLRLWLRKEWPSTHDAGHTALIVMLGLLFRITLWGVPATLSDDIHRYIWDGRVQADGINPYRYAPDAEQLIPLRDDSHSLINHPEVPTIYPPFAQLVFLLAFLISPAPLTVKVVFTLFEVGTAWFLHRLLVRRNAPPRFILVYLWCPLQVLEVAGSGHMDPAAIFWMVGAFLWVEEGKVARASAALGLSILSKPFGLALLPALWAGLRPGERVRSMLTVAAVVGAGYLPYVWAGEKIFAGLRIYAEHWEFNDILFRYLAGLVGSPRASRLLVAAMFGVIALFLAFRKIEVVTAGFVLVGAFLLMTPTLHPWYALWMVPFLVFERSAAWLLLTGMLPLSYHVLIRYAPEGVWAQAEWVRWSEYLPFAALIVAEQAWKRGTGMRGLIRGGRD